MKNIPVLLNRIKRITMSSDVRKYDISQFLRNLSVLFFRTGLGEIYQMVQYRGNVRPVTLGVISSVKSRYFYYHGFSKWKNVVRLILSKIHNVLLLTEFCTTNYYILFIANKVEFLILILFLIIEINFNL